MAVRHRYNIDVSGYLGIVFFFTFLGIATTETTWKHFCTEDWEFAYGVVVKSGARFATDHNSAVGACRPNGYALMKVDTLSLAQEIKEKGPSNPARIHIGASTDDCLDTRYKFCWLDGSNVSVDFDVTYINGQKCLIYERNNPNTLPTLRTWNCAAELAYVCQRKKSLPVIDATNLTVIDASTMSVRCETEYCSPKWILENGTAIGEVALTSGIWQTGENQEYDLWIQNPSEYDSGIYYCRTSRNQSTYQSLEVRVQGKPSIVAVETPSCSANVTLVWIPGMYAVDYNHTISISDGQTFEVVPTTNTTQLFTISTLLPSTGYKLNITSCKGDCTLNFLPPSASVNTKGRPNKVEDISSSLKSNLTCVVSWKSRPALDDDISFMIRTVETSLLFRLPSPILHVWEDKTDLPHYNFKIQPNRAYAVTIKAKRCNKISEAVINLADCRIPQSAPEHVAAPQIIPTNSTPFPDVRLIVPDESNGLISCLLVMISSNSDEDRLLSNIATLSYSIAGFREALSSSSESQHYLAIAVSPSKFVNSNGDIRFAVGDGSKSSCDLMDSSSVTLAPSEDCSREVICAENKPLQELKSYIAYAVAIVYASDSLSVKASAYTKLDTRESENQVGILDFGIILGAAFGAATFIILLFGLAILILLKKLNLRKANDSHRPPNIGTTTNHENSAYAEIFSSNRLNGEPAPPTPLQTALETNAARMPPAKTSVDSASPVEVTGYSQAPTLIDDLNHPYEIYVKT